jgi:predicted lipoprotein
LLDDWRRPGGWRETMLTAAGGNDAYYDAEEAAKDLLKSLHAALDLAIAAKLEEPLGETGEKARPKRLESWRSELSLANLRANLATARALYAADGGFADLLAAKGGSAAIDQAIAQRFERIFALLDGIGMPLEAAITEPEPRESVLELLAELQALRRTVRNELAPALGLVIGFNATDGD